MNLKFALGLLSLSTLCLIATGAYGTPSESPNQSERQPNAESSSNTEKHKGPNHEVLPGKKTDEAKNMGALALQSDWRSRAMNWFKTKTLKERGKEMRTVSRVLRKPCKYCHTKNFDGFTEKRLITQQMMAMAVENDVQCGDCHAGRGKYTPLGHKTFSMWKLSHDRKVFCGHCHTPKSKFKGLTDAGKAHREEAKNQSLAP